MIILDTHVWLWWINRDQIRLKPAWIARIDSVEPAGVSAISCFEVAWLAHHRRIELPDAEEDWFNKALDGSGILLLPITPPIRPHRRSTPRTPSRSPRSTHYRHRTEPRCNTHFCGRQIPTVCRTDRAFAPIRVCSDAD